MRPANHQCALGLILALFLTGCASTPESATDASDPWQGLNRQIFEFNEVADKYVSKPLAQSYRFVTPDFVERGIGNMFDNAREVLNVFNDLLQLKVLEAGSDTGRLFINTTVGVLGFFDVASYVGLESRSEDFGQTLGFWGVSSGPYVVLPIMGPSTLRDALALPVDSTVDRINHLEHVPTRNQLNVLRLIDTRAALLDSEELVSGDKYVFLRDAYLQRREYLINDGEVVEDSFGDEDFESWDDF